ncbi:hypothetical protein JKY79_00250 [Candidatus Babeliales bacterium]|nr:hypothetical protein [Candidatus Babeliales bacterium]
MYKTLKKILLIALILSSTCYAAAEKNIEQDATEFMDQFKTFDDCIKYLERDQEFYLLSIDITDEELNTKAYNWRCLPLFVTLNGRHLQKTIELLKLEQENFNSHDLNIHNYYNITKKTIFQAMMEENTIGISNTSLFGLKVAIVKAFLILYKHEAEKLLHVKDSNGDTLLMNVLSRMKFCMTKNPYYLSMIKLLLSVGSDPSAINKNGLNCVQLLMKIVHSNKHPFPQEKDAQPIIQLLQKYMDRA